MGSRYLGRRAIQALVTIFAIVLLNFVLFRAMPGSPDRLSHNPNASAAAQAALRARWGLDRPLFPDQFVDYIASTVQGDFGESFKYRNQPVTEVIGSRIGPTLILFGSASSSRSSSGWSSGVLGLETRRGRRLRAAMGSR